jgi:ABC-2 type transport system ATP-binding protein
MGVGGHLPDLDEDPPVVIELDQLTKRFGPLTALDDLSFAVQPGRVTGFLGPNGAGTSLCA